MATRSVGQAERRPDERREAFQVQVSTPFGPAPSNNQPVQRQIQELMSESARLADAVDRHCFFTHGDLLDVPETPQSFREYAAKVELELDYLRDAVKRLGWHADLAVKALGGGEEVRDGDATRWLLSPAFQQSA